MRKLMFSSEWCVGQLEMLYIETSVIGSINISTEANNITHAEEKANKNELFISRTNCHSFEICHFTCVVQVNKWTFRRKKITKTKG